MVRKERSHRTQVWPKKQSLPANNRNKSMEIQGYLVPETVWSSERIWEDCYYGSVITGTQEELSKCHFPSCLAQPSLNEGKHVNWLMKGTQIPFILQVPNETPTICQSPVIHAILLHLHTDLGGWNVVHFYHELQHARPPCPSPVPGVYSNSCPLSQWCHPTISSSVVPFSSCPQSFPASGSFPMSQLFT